MSGAISATTIAAVASAAAGVGSLAYGIVQGQSQQNAQDKALKQQKGAQQQAEAETLSQRRASETAQNAANKKTPDISSIIARAAQSGASGVSGTMLTGPSGVNQSSLNLGKSTLLGG